MLDIISFWRCLLVIKSISVRTHDAILPQGCLSNKRITAQNTKVEEGGNFLSFIKDTAKETYLIDTYFVQKLKVTLYLLYYGNSHDNILIHFILYTP